MRRTALRHQGIALAALTLTACATRGDGPHDVGKSQIDGAREITLSRS